jgi:hypothetical protein
MGPAGTNATVVTDIRQEKGEYSFAVRGPSGEHRVRFWGDISEDPFAPRSEPALAVALLPAMAAGGKLSIPGPLSPQLLRALPDVQAVLEVIETESSLMTPPLQAVDLSIASTDAPESASAGAAGVGAFFSGGVDSWLTVLDNPDITDLTYVQGFDVPIGQPEASGRIESRLARAAARQGKRFRVVRTDLRDLVDISADWAIGHGPAMAAIALLLAPSCGRVLIPSTNTYAELSARGSHPLLDHLWSTERCRIEHHGAYLTRARKIARLAECQDALEVLRVCWRQVDRYNCGICEKCLRTMVALEAVGELERCSSFSVPLDLNAVAQLRFHDPELPIFWRENLALAHAQSAPENLSEAIEACLVNNEAPPVHIESPAQAQLEEVLSSQSWRFTAPLRHLAATIRRLRQKASER